MGHRKYSSPRHGSLGFLPKKRSRSVTGRIRSFPKDQESKAPHFTAFMGYKAGMTQVMRTLNRTESQWDARDIVEACTVVETPPIVIVGIVGYSEGAKGLRCLTTVWGPTISEAARRRFYRHWTKSKRKAFKKYLSEPTGAKLEAVCDKIKKNCSVVRVIAHTQPSKINSLKQRKAHMLEIQINGGDIKQKVEFALAKLGKELTIDEVFGKNELVDTVSVTTGKGMKGVVSRWGVSILSRKSHRGNRKVACVGAWHPANISYTVGRNGQKGFHHRTETNKKIYLVGKPEGSVDETGKRIWQAQTPADLTPKDITPRGGFPSYGIVKNSFLLLKGSVAGSTRRPITLRKSYTPPCKVWHTEVVKVKWIDTSSNLGHTNWQTDAEKLKYYGLNKVQKAQRDAAEAEADLAKSSK